MRRRTIAAVLIAGLLATSTAAAAGGKKVKESGSVKGDSGAEVHLVVIKSGGDPKSVKNVTFKNLRTNCSDGTTRIKLKLYGAAKVGENRKFASSYEIGKSKIKLEGKVKRDGSRVHGSIRGKTIKVSGVGRCDVPSVEFTTKR